MYACHRCFDLSLYKQLMNLAGWPARTGSVFMWRMHAAGALHLNSACNMRCMNWQVLWGIKSVVWRVVVTRTQHSIVDGGL